MPAGRLKTNETEGRITLSRPITFSFNGKTLQGYQGDTLASALLANGIHLVGRSWKYHRPRGILGSGTEEPNAVVQLGIGARTVPNVLATQLEIYEGLEASSVNCWPSLEHDLLSVNGWFSRLMPAGFYYKTFMWPKSMWMKYEQAIRRASGLGVSPNLPDPDRYEKTYAHCDVLVVGAGPAGLMAALAAGRTGARVILADEQSEPGGSLLYSRETIEGLPAMKWVAGVWQELESMEEMKLLRRSTVFGYHDQNFLTIAERLNDHLPRWECRGARERLWKVRARQVVLASGALERPLVFGNNDRPGVMLASAVSCYINRFAVAPGSRCLVFTNNDSAYGAALDMVDAGIQVQAVVDCRPRPRGVLPERLRQRGVEIIAGSVVVNVKGTHRVKAAQVMQLPAQNGILKGEKRLIHCDLLAMSGGWSPVVHLSSQSGARARWDDARACFLPGMPVQQERSAGAANGSFSLNACLSEGSFAGREAARLAGWEWDNQPDPPSSSMQLEEPVQPLWLVPSEYAPGRGPKQFVDMQNDVGAADIILAAREGYHSIEHVKRYTALGFGTDQGKVGNINGMAILAQSLGATIADTGTTTFRPNYTPVTFGAIAGQEVGEKLFEPVRKTALHEWHQARGAAFENVGQWKRPWYYPKSGESMQEAVNRECLATRESVGIIDVSTLGKIVITGKDSGEFLNRIYTNAWKKLAIDKARYGLMLGEDGMVMDDGVTIRLSENRYYMHTTTGGAAGVYSWMERWLQTEWPDLQVFLISVTDHWATAAVVGPNSRRVMMGACQGIDFSAQSFPFMSSREGTVGSIPARINRISFSGELAYEVNVPANLGKPMWEVLMAVGEEFGITPYGTETMHVLRAEKGYIIVGQDTDGSVTPDDLGMGWALSKTKDFLGKRSLAREDCMREDRKQLVGLLTINRTEVLPEGGQIVEDPDAAIPVPMIGHVTSSYYSACLGHSIALALVQGGRSRIGEIVHIPLAEGRVIPARISDPVFYDPDGERQNV
ncbi:MAG: sarcosine oxidase subunit alpha [Gammaproteobacteria bacterium]|nr:sarcosine oxidase subunit alpha [Gammaproteobacteria bacterium]